MPGDNRLPKRLSRLCGLLRAYLCVIIYSIDLQVCFAGHGWQFFFFFFFSVLGLFFVRFFFPGLFFVFFWGL